MTIDDVDDGNGGECADVDVNDDDHDDDDEYNHKEDGFNDHRNINYKDNNAGFRAF